MATIHKYLKVGFEILSIKKTTMVVRKMEAISRRPITLKIPKGFPALRAGHAFIAEKRRGEIMFYY